MKNITCNNHVKSVNPFNHVAATARRQVLLLSSLQKSMYVLKSIRSRETVQEGE